MSKPFDNLNEEFDMEPMKEESKELSREVKKVSTDCEQDYSYVRGHLTDLMEKGSELLDGAMEVAEQTQHPRAYEVASNSLKTMSEVAEKLMDLQKKMKDLEKMNEESKSPGPSSVHNTLVLSGTMSDIMKTLKEAESKET